MIAVARVSVMWYCPLVLWFGIQGSRPKVCKLAIRVNVDLASLHGPPGFF